MTRRRKTRIKLPRSVRRLFPQVTHAEDAITPVEVSVNAKDCQQATAMNPAECALARATKREQHCDGVIIGLSSSYLIKGKKAIRFQTPESVQREIVSFDRHNDFAPGDYYLTPKSPGNRLGDSQTRKDSGSRTATKRKVHQSVRVRLLHRGTD